MANMSYCRFQNTGNDLADCYDHIEDDVEELDEYEQRGRAKVIRYCQEILLAEGYDIEDPQD